ncbi:MAG TPA: tetratricopeptide repeat protein [Bryobacteraceae bacterium]|nr:tetratricopeptide repeat protein [Bryobacteraceae bacterium]
MKRPFQLIVFAFYASLTFGASLDHGRELYQQGKYSEAESELQKVVGENGDDAQARLFLGLSLLEQNKLENAKPHLERADQLAASGETKVALAHLFALQKEVDRAEAALAEASGPDVGYVRGLYLLHKGNFEESARAFESYLETSKSRPYAHYYAGLAYNGVRQTDKMLTHFEMFLRLKPDAPEARKVRNVVRSR